MVSELQKKSKLLYYSPECFLDVDFPVLEVIAEKYDVLWILIMDSINFYSDDEIKYFCHNNNINLFKIERKYRRSSIFQIGVSKRIVSRIKSFDPDVLYFEQFDNPFITIYLYLLMYKKRMVIGVHDVKPHSNHANRLTKFHKNVYLRVFKNYHLFSNSQRDYFESNYGKANIFVIPLNLKDFGNPEKREMPSNTLKLLFFGKIHKYKGLDILIESINALPNSYDVSVTIAGNCKNFEIYENLIKRKAYDFKIGFIENDMIPGLFSNHDFLVLPYKDVTQSGPLYIAYNYNLPIIASDLPEFKEHIKDGYNGFLFAANDSISLKNKIVEIVDANNKESIRLNLKEYTKSNYNKLRIGKSYIKMFNEVKNG